MILNRPINTFLVVSDKRSRAEYFTDVINTNFRSSAVFHVSKWFEVKSKLDNIRPKAVIFDDFNFDSLVSGCDLKILKAKYNSEVAIVIVSSRGHIEMFSEEKAQGRVNFVSQPYSEEALVSCLSGIIAPHFRKPDYSLKQLQPGEILIKQGRFRKTLIS